MQPTHAVQHRTSQSNASIQSEYQIAHLPLSFTLSTIKSRLHKLRQQDRPVEVDIDTAAEMLLKLRQFAESLGRVPNFWDLQDAPTNLALSSGQYFVDVFASFPRARYFSGICAAGATTAAMITDLKGLATAIGRSPRREEIEQAAREGKMFGIAPYQSSGGINAWKRRADIPINRRRGRAPRFAVDTEALIRSNQALRELSQIIGTSVTFSALQKAAKSDHSLVPERIIGLHGSIPQARIAAGLYDRGLGPEELKALLLDDMIDLAARTGIPVFQLNGRHMARAASRGEIFSLIKYGKEISSHIDELRATAIFHSNAAQRHRWENIIQEVTRPGQLLTVSQLLTSLDPAAKKLFKAFGSISLIRRAFGQVSYDASLEERQQEALCDLKDYTSRHEILPSEINTTKLKEAFKAGETPSFEVLRNLFGSLSNVQIAVEKSFVPGRVVAVEAKCDGNTDFSLSEVEISRADIPQVTIKRPNPSKKIRPKPSRPARQADRPITTNKAPSVRIKEESRDSALAHDGSSMEVVSADIDLSEECLGIPPENLRAAEIEVLILQGHLDRFLRIDDLQEAAVSNTCEHALSLFRHHRNSMDNLIAALKIRLISEYLGVSIKLGRLAEYHNFPKTSEASNKLPPREAFRRFFLTKEERARESARRQNPKFSGCLTLDIQPLSQAIRASLCQFIREWLASAPEELGVQSISLYPDINDQNKTIIKRLVIGLFGYQSDLIKQVQIHAQSA